MFYGRESDLNELLTLWDKRVSSLITCRGRRRIGKSTLIREFAKKSKARLIQLEGVRPRVGLSNEDELRHFSRMLAAQTAAENSLPENWLIAFKRLGGRSATMSGRSFCLTKSPGWAIMTNCSPIR